MVVISAVYSNNDSDQLTQSFSTDTKFMIDVSFSIQASKVAIAKSPHVKPRDMRHPLARNQNVTQEAATASR
jgi:hypothetical protein